MENENEGNESRCIGTTSIAITKRKKCPDGVSGSVKMKQRRDEKQNNGHDITDRRSWNCVLRIKTITIFSHIFFPVQCA